MSRMIPPIPDDFHGSKAEKEVFRALRSLPDDIVVIHSFRWLHPGNARALTRRLASQGEGDFVLINPAKGILVVEVKGGDVWCEQGEWFQRNRSTGDVQPINPEAQAANTMYRIRTDLVQRVPDSQNVLFCHAVWFPDGIVDRAKLPMNYHTDMTLDEGDLQQPSVAIDRVFRYWGSLHPRRSGTGKQTHAILSLLAPSFSIVRSLRHTLDEREELLIQLTREQARILEFLDEQFHAAIHGAAGTGKTLLAVEKARRIATPSETVLLLCFNSALRDHLRSHHAQPNVTYQTFHGLAREVSGRDGSLEQATKEFLEYVSDDGPLPYQHLIVDEGQDLNSDWLELLQYKFRNGAFYVFYDRYQAVQGERDAAWLNDIPCRLVLTRNCRNTDPIARAAYRAAGLRISPTLGLAGPKPVLHSAEDDQHAVERANDLVAAACKKYGTKAHEIAVLSLETIGDESPWRVARIGGCPVAETPQPNHVTVTTVRRFKGLEAALVLVVDVDFKRTIESVWRLLLYIACSRARHAVHVISTTRESDLASAVRELAGSAKTRTSWRSLCTNLGLRFGGTIDDPFEQ